MTAVNTTRLVIDAQRILLCLIKLGKHPVSNVDGQDGLAWCNIFICLHFDTM